MPKRHGGRAGPSGFTLVEVLIVVAILGILAVVVAPQFGKTISQSKEAALASNLLMIRKIFERYRVQHDDTYPVVFAAQLLITTNKAGLPGTEYGPYLRTGFPKNPINGDSSVITVVKMPDGPTGTSGWIYALTDGDFRANVSGTASSDVPYFEM